MYSGKESNKYGGTAVQWTADLATGAQDIDEQHKELFRRIDTLLEAWKQGEAGMEVDKVIQFLTDYVVVHFGTEEQYMTKFNYGTLSAHKAQHELFVKTFGKLRNRYMKEGTTPLLLEDTIQLLVGWQKNHIRYSDKALGLFQKMKMEK